MVGKSPGLTQGCVAFAVGVAVSGVAAAQAPTWLVDGSCRDGQTQGRYELRDGNGGLRVVGAFNLGRRTGSFIFWTAAGARIAHIPYDDDARNGTLATWYETRGSDREPSRRFESAWRRGVRDGLTRTWYANGQRRTETEYVEGRIVTTIGWTNAGERVSDSAARDIAARDATAADAEYAELEALVREHLPRCD
ncbi:MAG: toxin-antitoxin system YwqK family antitoxin [Betaproteobacteria bacterium]